MANFGIVIWVLSPFKSVILAELTQIPGYQKSTIFELGGENLPLRYLVVPKIFIF